MVQIVNDIVKIATIDFVKTMNYIWISYDEVTNFDSQSWLSLHIDVNKDGFKIPIMVFPPKVIEGATFRNLTKIITQALLTTSGRWDIVFKLICLRWVFSKVLKAKLHGKSKWIMFLTCKASIAWPIKLILACKLCLN